MKHIMLVCNAGMSTSLLVQKMEKAAQAKGVEVEIEARPMNEAMESFGNADVLLLGPQIGYTKRDFEAAVEGRIPVTVIAMMDYGRMNGEKILDDALALIG